MVSEGRVGAEYLDYADELNGVVSKYHHAAMKEIAEREFATT